MRVSRFVRDALRLCIAAAILAGCGGHAGDGVVPSNAAPNSSFPYHKTFSYTGGAQYFTVPAGVSQLRSLLLGLTAVAIRCGTAPAAAQKVATVGASAP